jgi:hypothetical protein
MRRHCHTRLRHHTNEETTERFPPRECADHPKSYKHAETIDKYLEGNAPPLPQAPAHHTNEETTERFPPRECADHPKSYKHAETIDQYVEGNAPPLPHAPTPPH